MTSDDQHEHEQIICFKESDERYAAAFTGDAVRFVPLLVSSPIGGAALRESFSDASGNIDALLFTSMRALEVFRDAMGHSASDNWSRVQVFALGSRQCDFVRVQLQQQLKCSFSSIQGDNCRNADELASLVLAQVSHDERLAHVHFLCGEKRMPTIESMLSRDAGVELRVTPLYVTAPVESLAPLSELIGDSTLKLPWLVFFSPSGVEIVATRHDDNRRVAAQCARIACIGETTARAVRKHLDCEPAAIASEPTPEALAAAIHRE
jgi:uroporphyrinogen-III synthase